jgi:CDP-6-deoxy-D-xylo-4-hexulose-3-dehydrase
MTQTLSKPATKLTWPLMCNNIAREDLDAIIELLSQDDPILTQSSNVRAFEREWSEWLGVKHSVFVNSGASANLLTMAALKEHYGPGEVIVPTLTWVSDIASVLQNGFKPVFVDIDPKSLGMDTDEVIRKLTPRTRAVFLTHVLGYNGLTQRLLDELANRKIPLIEDVCESHGATFQGRKLGTYGLVSNFSFYYAHHLTTVEGGMITTDNDDLYQTFRMLRSHGMVRESTCDQVKRSYQEKHPDLNPDFIFAFPAYNVRSTELNAVMGRSQLKRLDKNNKLRANNLDIFLKHLDPNHYRVDFATAGNSNYAFTLVLKHPDAALCDRVMSGLRQAGIEFRRGMSGGGNQLRQPYLKNHVSRDVLKDYPHVDHVHFYGFYIGNYPQMPSDQIVRLCNLLNGLTAQKYTKVA